MRKFFLLVVITIFSARIWQSTGCLNFLPTYFDTQIVKIKVEEQVNLDRGIDRGVSRFFHNKASTGFFETAKATSKFSDPIFLLDILGPLGLVLIIFATSSLVKKFTPLKGFHFLLVLVAIILATVGQNSKISFYTVSAALYSFSLWGTTTFKTNRLAIFAFFALALVTLWYFAFSWTMRAVCNEIFFN